MNNDSEIDTTDNGGWPIAYIDIDEYYAMRQRAEAAEAQLAAMPVDVLRRWFDESYVEYSNHYSREQAEADYAAIKSWLQSRK